MSDKDKEVGRRLKSERQRLGLNIFSVAESIMRSKTGYEKYENGQRSLPRELEEPLQGLGFDMDYVVRNIRRHYPVAQNGQSPNPLVVREDAAVLDMDVGSGKTILEVGRSIKQITNDLKTLASTFQQHQGRVEKTLVHCEELYRELDKSQAQDHRNNSADSHKTGLKKK